MIWFHVMFNGRFVFFLHTRREKERKRRCKEVRDGSHAVHGRDVVVKTDGVDWIGLDWISGVGLN